MLKHRIVATALVASAGVAAWTTTSGGQEESAVERRAVIVSQPGGPAAPGTPAAAAASAEPSIHREFHIQTPVMEALVELADETGALHEQDRAHEHSTRQLIRQYRDAESGSDRSELQEKLAATVREHFEVRQQMREKELVELETRVRRLRELHDKREDAKAEIVEQRVEQLIREAEGLGWSNGGERPTVNYPNTFKPHIDRREIFELRRPRTTR